MNPEHTEGQIIHVADKGRRFYVRAELVRAVFNQESASAPRVTYYNNAQFDMDWQSWSSYKRVFEANNISLIPVVSTQGDNPLSGYLNAEFARVVPGVNADTPVISHDMSDDWFVPLNEAGELMTHADLQELGVECPEPEAAPA